MTRNAPGPTNNYAKSDLVRWVLIGCGWASVVAGAIGVVLPLVPTIPFLLLAAACFARSSERFHTWLVEHNHLGPLVRHYRHGDGIPPKAKGMAIGMVWVSFPASAFLLVPVVWVRIVLMAVAIAVTLYLLGLPTSRPGEMGSENGRNGKPL